MFDVLAIIPYHLIDVDRVTRGPVGATLRYLRLSRLSRLVQSARHIIEAIEIFFSNYARWIKKNIVHGISSIIW